MSNPSTKFEPSDNQRRLLSLFQESDYVESVQNVCGRADLDPSTFYKWFNNAEFCEWWTAEAEAFFSRVLPRVYGAIYEGVTDRSEVRLDPRFANLFLQKFDRGFMPKSRTEVTGADGGPAQFSFNITTQGGDSGETSPTET